MQIQTPDWVKQAVFYQIFPDRFARGIQASHPWLQSIPLEDWDADPTLQGYKGGNLWGVIDQLDYLQELGINAIYFTPIFQSTSNHRYHTSDYYQVDPLLGGNVALEKLLHAAHSRNIKVVLDGVFNHTGRGFFFFNDILENGPHSPWVDWFKVEKWPLSAYDGAKPANYAGWAGNRALPEFNHANPAVREYIMQVAEYWIRFGIDGWRLDVPFEIDEPGFWQEFRDRVKAINPNAYIVGEVWRDSRKWLDGTQFDGVMNYLFTGPTIAFAAGDRVQPEVVERPDYDPHPALDAERYAQKMTELFDLYDWEIHLAQLNLLSSHDTPRIWTVADQDVASVKLSVLLQMTFPGAPSIYYGDEVGLPGAMDPDCRRGFPPPSQWNSDIFNCHKSLISLRRQYPALRTGQYHTLYAKNSTYILSRTLGSDTMAIAVNVGEKSDRVSLTLDQMQLQAQPGRILYGDGEAHWDGGNLSLTIPARSGFILG